MQRVGEIKSAWMLTISQVLISNKTSEIQIYEKNSRKANEQTTALKSRLNMKINFQIRTAFTVCESSDAIKPPKVKIIKMKL